MNIKSLAPPAILLALVLGLWQCKVTDQATPEEKTKLEEIDAEVKVLDATAEELEKQAMEEMKVAAKAQIEADQIKFDEAIAKFEAIRAEWIATTKSLQVLEAEERELVDSIMARTTNGLQALGGAISAATGVPAGGFLPFIGLLFDRPRKHLVTASKRLVKGQVGDFFSYLAKAYGLKHSSYDPQEIHRAAVDLALKKGDISTAVALDPAIKGVVA